MSEVGCGRGPEGFQHGGVGGAAEPGLGEQDGDAVVRWHDVSGRSGATDPAVAADDVPRVADRDVDPAAVPPSRAVEEHRVGGASRRCQLVGHHRRDEVGREHVVSTGEKHPLEA